MEFDKNYFEAREEAVRWLRRDPSRQDYATGIGLLERLRFKPLLTRRLKACADNPSSRRILVQAVSDGVNVYRNPSKPKFADTIPAEIEEMTGGTLPPPPQEVSEAKDVPVEPASPFPDAVRRLMRWYSDAYRRRDRLHREMRSLGEGNDPPTMARRKVLSDRINTLTDYMDELYPLREEYDSRHVEPTEGQLTAIGAFDVWEARHALEEPSGVQPSATVDAASFRKKDENFDTMPLPELRKRRASIRTMIVRKQNQLLYQSDAKQEKENPMPICPERTKTEHQLEALKQKLYLVVKAISKFG